MPDDEWRFGILDETEWMDQLYVREVALNRRLHVARLREVDDEHRAAVRLRVAQLRARARVYGSVVAACLDGPMTALRIAATTTGIEISGAGVPVEVACLDRPALLEPERTERDDRWIVRASRAGLDAIGSWTDLVPEPVDPDHTTVEQYKRYLDSLEERIAMLEAAATPESNTKPAPLAEEQLVDQLFDFAESLGVQIALSPLPAGKDSLGLPACFVELEVSGARRRVAALVCAIDGLPGATGFDRLNTTITDGDVELRGTLLSYQF